MFNVNYLIKDRGNVPQPDIAAKQRDSGFYRAFPMEDTVKTQANKIVN